MNLNPMESIKFNYRDLIIFLLPILIFGLYLFVYNPGILTVSSFSQIHQIVTGEFTNAHPIFHTLLEMAGFKIAGTPLIVGVFQILIFSALWMVICNYHRNDTQSDEFFLQFIVTLVICLIPINAVYSVTLSSNILFSYSILFLCFLIKIMVDNEGEIDRKLIIIMALAIAVMSGLSTYGIYVALISLIAIIAYLHMKGSPKNTIITLAGISLVCILLIGSLSFIYGVENDPFNIPTDDTFDDGVDVNGARSQFFSMINGEPTDNLEKTTPANLNNDKYNSIDSYVNMFRENFILDSLFNNPISYMVLSILLLAAIYVFTQSREIFLLYIPPFVNVIASLLTGQTNQYSCLLVFYMVVIIFISFYFKSKLIPSDSKNVSPISAPETPQVIEPQENYQEDNPYLNIESEIDALNLDEINEMLDDTTEEPQNVSKDQESDESSDEIPDDSTEELQSVPIEQESDESSDEMESDLIDEILREIENEKK